MRYKVFLVEDEVMTREGIRDSAIWAETGYQFCGEAPDGELALPLIRQHQPHIVITDIKMPFMDGLQLSRVLRTTMPATKIIILSGHDEFKYAQEAIQAGVTEYLLKPLSARDLRAALQRVGHLLDREQEMQAQLAALQAQVSDQYALLRERYVLHLVAGTLPPSELIDSCQNIGMDIIAPWYQTVLIRLHAPADGQPAHLADTERAVAQALDAIPDLLWGRSERLSTVVIIRGESAGDVAGRVHALQERLHTCPPPDAPVHVTVQCGQPVDRIGLIARSYAAAQADQQPGAPAPAPLPPTADELVQALRSGTRSTIPRHLAAYLQQGTGLHTLLETGLHAIAGVVRDLGAPPEMVLSDRHTDLLPHHHTAATVHDALRDALEHAIDYRDRQTHHQRALIDRARRYIETHYADPDISLNAVAAVVTLSPSYFSVVFGREAGQTFVEFLTGVRIRHAIELLRTTALTSSEIALRVGYQNPRYFHTVFRKATGQSPIGFRRHT